MRVKNWLSISWSVWLVLLFSGVAMGQQITGSTLPPGSGVDLPLGEWKTFTAEKGNFSVLLPGEPRTRLQEASGIKWYVFELYTRQRTFTISYLEFSSQAPSAKAMIAAARSGMLEVKDAKLINERPVELGSYKGQEFAVQTPKGLAHVRCLVDGSKAYQVGITLHNKTDEAKEARAFLDSFKLIPPAKGKK